MLKEISFGDLVTEGVLFDEIVMLSVDLSRSRFTRGICTG